jgi:hypothetical protein
MSNVLNLHFAKHWCVLILQNKIYLTEIKFTGYNTVPKPFLWSGLFLSDELYFSPHSYKAL